MQWNKLFETASEDTPIIGAELLSCKLFIFLLQWNEWTFVSSSSCLAEHWVMGEKYTVILMKILGDKGVVSETFYFQQNFWRQFKRLVSLLLTRPGNWVSYCWGNCTLSWDRHLLDVFSILPTYPQKNSQNNLHFLFPPGDSSHGQCHISGSGNTNFVID